MEFIKNCCFCIYWSCCPCGWSNGNAACLTIQKPISEQTNSLNKNFNEKARGGCPVKCENLAERKLLENGYDSVVIFNDLSYDTALVGVTNTHRAVYSYELMLEYLVSKEGFSDYTEAAEWIDYNTLGSLPSFGGCSPIILYPKLYDEQTALECALDMGYEEGDVYIIPELDSAFLGISHNGVAVYDLESSKEIIPSVTESTFYTENTLTIFVKLL